MGKIANLQPSAIWKYFDEITQIPRPSKKEEKIRDYLHQWAAKHGLPIVQDSTGNIIITKQATDPTLSGVILQSHVDMVCEKNSETEHDFDNDPIQTSIDGEWVTAQGTTLGADNGIGMAAMLAILDSENIPHGELEALFTTEEETGLTGAYGLEEGTLQNKILLNLDSEDEGELFIGCAGGIDTTIMLPYKRQQTPNKAAALKLTIRGLTGGHSGCDIHLGRGNSNVIAAHFLYVAAQQTSLSIADMQGGNLRNAIPREATVTFIIPDAQREKIKELFKKYAAEVKSYFQNVEPSINLTLEQTDLPPAAYTETDSEALLRAIISCPNGVIALSKTMPDLVETSSNLARIKTNPDGIEIVTSQRSDQEFSKQQIAQSVAAAFQNIGGTIRHSDGYPGWAPNPHSEVLQVALRSYEKLFDKKPEIKAIHAGLECGLFLKKYPHLDMVSLGPTIRNPHSPDECVHIPTVEKFWQLLLQILKELKK